MGSPSKGLPQLTSSRHCRPNKQTGSDVPNLAPRTSERQVSGSSSGSPGGDTKLNQRVVVAQVSSALTKTGERDRLILDRDLPEQESELGIWANPEDVDEAARFTLEAELVRLASLLKDKGSSTANPRATNNQIKSRMKQAEEDKDKLSQR